MSSNYLGWTYEDTSVGLTRSSTTDMLDQKPVDVLIAEVLRGPRIACIGLGLRRGA